MAQLVSVDCPNCGNRLQLDPDLEVASCGSCNKSSFVQTPQRRVPPEVLRGGARVIDVAPRRAFPLVRSMAAFWVVALAAFGWLQARKHSPSAVVSAPSSETPSEVAASVGSLHAPTPELRPRATPEPPPPVESAGAPEPTRSAKATTRNGARQKVVHSIVRAGAITVSGRLPPELIQRVVRQNFARIRLCHEQGLNRNAGLAGRVGVRFVIGRDGSVSNVSNAESTLADTAVVSCALRAFYGLEFPKPEGGIVTVVYPLLFSVEG